MCFPSTLVGCFIHYSVLWRRMHEVNRIDGFAIVLHSDMLHHCDICKSAPGGCAVDSEKGVDISEIIRADFIPLYAVELLQWQPCLICYPRRGRRVMFKNTNNETTTLTISTTWSDALK